jgi:hypothetical protein
MTLCVERLLEGGWREFEVKDYIFIRWGAGTELVVVNGLAEL